MRGLATVLATVFVLSGCGSAALEQRRREALLAEMAAAERQAKLRKAEAEAEELIEKECRKLKGHVAAARCVQEKRRPLMVERGDPHMDLVDLQFAYQLALARRMDEGTLTEEDTKLLDAELAVRINAEIQRREILAQQARLQAEHARMQQAQLEAQQAQQAQQSWQNFIRMLNENLQRQRDRDALTEAFTAPRTMPPITCYQYGNMIQCQ